MSGFVGQFAGAFGVVLIGDCGCCVLTAPVLLGGNGGGAVFCTDFSGLVGRFWVVLIDMCCCCVLSGPVFACGNCGGAEFFKCTACGVGSLLLLGAWGMACLSPGFAGRCCCCVASCDTENVTGVATVPEPPGAACIIFGLSMTA